MIVNSRSPVVVSLADRVHESSVASTAMALPDGDVGADYQDGIGKTVIAWRGDAIEGKAYITRWGEQSRDPETMRYRYSFDVDWITTR